MDRIRQLVRDLDLMLGILVSLVLGGVVGFVMGHPLGHMLFGSTIGVAIFAIYTLAYSFGTLWLVGVERGLLVVSTFVWSIILSAFLSSSPEVPSVVGMFLQQRVGAVLLHAVSTMLYSAHL
ncbi:MAG: hypothetical protein HYZ81_08485 [Nitrospinae bacterium]|nr:hypothetical protein [Nitrospinota bacterium]